MDADADADAGGRTGGGAEVELRPRRSQDLPGLVALHPAEGAGLPGWQQATGRGPEGLAVVSRLFTDRSLPGAGAALLAEAVARARAADRAPVLQVDPDSTALDWYRRRGWREVGTARQTWGHRTVDAVLLVP